MSGIRDESIGEGKPGINRVATEKTNNLTFLTHLTVGLGPTVARDIPKPHYRTVWGVKF